MARIDKARYKIENEEFVRTKAESGEYEQLKGDMLMRWIAKGESDRTPSLTDIVFCNYKGMLIDGSVFDSTEGEPYPAYFRVRELIEGWQIALVRMHPGDKCEIVLPAKMGYGSMKVDGIPANSTLIFELELVKIS
ncbi:MAG: FKBP-type peptidyl-prolyl cis-trans isomerase [Bacteroidales bacterium]|nr:FKBP-type peptidyl-prolyl cis-trans isomerase [Bacteroidales bacterium]